MRWLLLGLVLCIAACAMAIGANSVATVDYNSTITRQVPASSPPIEEILIEK